MIKTADLTPRQKKIAIALVAVLVFYILFGFIGTPFIVRSLLEKQVARAINRNVTVESVRVNPITLSVTLRGVDVRENSGNPFVKMDEAYINLQTSSLFKWALVLKSVRVNNPDISLVRTDETEFNFSDIGGDKTPNNAETNASAESSGFAFAIYETQISGGKIAFDDRAVSVNHRIDGLELSVSDLSSRPTDVDVFTLFNLTAQINGAAFSLDGKTRPFGTKRETKVELGVKELHAPHYLPYATLPENLIVRSLTLETKTEIDFQMLEDGKPDLVVAGLLSLIDARLADKNGDPFVYHPNLKFDLLPSKVLTGQLRLAQVETTEPEYFLKRLHTGELYLPFLTVTALDEAEEKAAEDTTGEFQPVVTIDQFDLNNGVVHFTDASNSDPFATTITDLDIEIKNLGLNSDRTATYHLSLQSEADEAVALSGTASLLPIQVSGDIDVSAVKVSRYVPYYKDVFDFKTVEGTISFGGNYRFRQEDDTPQVSLTGVHVDVEKLNVVDEDDDEPLITIGRLSVANTTAQLAQRQVTLGSLVLSNVNLVCRREKDGDLNVLKAFAPTAKTSETGDTGASAGLSSGETTPPFALTLNSVKVTDVAVDVEDRVPKEHVKLRLDKISLTASHLSTVPGSKGKADLSLRWEQEGQIHTVGAVTIDPLNLDMKVKVREMDVRPFQPYLSEQVGLIVTQGFFNTDGKMALSMKKDALPVIEYQGKAGLNRFSSIDQKNANDFLKWEALLLEDLQVGVNPTRLSIDQVSLSDFFARVVVDADGSVNLVSMFSDPKESTADVDETAGQKPPPEPAVTSSAEKNKPSVRIARVTLSGGDVDFSDRFIKPNFNAKFHDLGGRVTGLESIAEKRADVLLEGMWSNHAPVKITGQVNPLIEQPYVDLNLNISDIELSPFSPYSGKYMGYILEKGKLTFNVAYLMENQKLEGKNSIYINQLTLGDTVDSPDAVSLPIKLAVALLKDREGNIELDLPVTGSLDDPEFKIGKVVWTVLKNLIVKIVTSPFAALGGMAGGGEELSYLDFDAGVSTISEENSEKMDKVAKILYERPALKLDIQGVADPKVDSDPLRAMFLENQLKAEKLQQMMKSGKSAVPLEEIVLSDEERPVILETVFTASGIPVPVDGSGKPVELGPVDMEKLLRTHTQITDDDFRKLANARAFSAKNYLLETGQVERERVFIVEPQAGTKGKEQDDAGVGRVIFSLK